MNGKYAEEMKVAFVEFLKLGAFSGKRIFIFGHCHASEIMADMFIQHGFTVDGIIDNNASKWGLDYCGIPICTPQFVLSYKNAVVCIASRFYEEMFKQLRGLGFSGEVLKLVDYNTYAEYSLSEDTIRRKKARLESGLKNLRRLEEDFPGCYRIFCPFDALGDVYMAISFLPHFLRKINRSDVVVIVPSRSCAEVAGLFAGCNLQVFEQSKLDATVQAVLYLQDKDSFIAHQDRPYAIDISYMLRAKCIPLEDLYRIGVYGLEKDVKAVSPTEWRDYPQLDDIPEGRSVILSPYAKSVTALADNIWNDIVKCYKGLGYRTFTNVFGAEKPLEGTEPISPSICEMKFVVERAGIFIGIRSGLCDVIRTANAKKIALYPDYYYSNTKWKAIDMYRLVEFENIVVKEGFTWKEI